jgi:hypothetical protein
MRVRSNSALSPEFHSFNGVPQGDPLSPLLYSLYTADLPDSLVHEGVELGHRNIIIKYLLYADDLVLLAHSPQELQRSITALEIYADQNELTVNAAKTKCLIFFRGYCPKSSFFYKGTEIECCKRFTYLGVVLTTQLAAGEHVKHVISKCNQRIGFLFAKLPLKDIPLPVVLDIFRIYVIPILQYALPLWFPRATEEAKKRLNSVFTKFLKRWLGVPYGTYNGLVHYVTGTEPLCLSLGSRLSKAFLNISYPPSVEGIQLEVPEDVQDPYVNVMHVPSFFWLTPILQLPLPHSPEVRRAILYDYFDLHHGRICSNSDHHEPSTYCVCELCGYSAERYHFRRCPAVMFKSPCGRLKYIMSL